MKVKYIGIKKENGSCETSSECLSIGTEYIVSEIYYKVNRDISYRLVGDNPDRSPAIFKATEFEVTSEYVPSNWVIKIWKNGSFMDGPASWQIPGFWEDCYDYDEAAQKIYTQEMSIIMDEINNPGKSSDIVK